MDYADDQGEIRGFWWEAKDNAVGEAVRRMIGSINTQCRVQREDTRFYMDLCSNSNTAGNDTYSYLANGQRWGWSRRMRQNICQAGADTWMSLVAYNRTVPIYISTLGDYTLARKLEQRSRVVQSLFYDLGIFDLVPEAARDACETGTGHLFVCEQHGKPRVERPLPNELYVDDFDGRYRSPRSLFRVHFVPREKLKQMRPKLGREIDQSGGPTDNDYVDFNLRADSASRRVRVMEAWHLPSGPDAKDGRHVICTDKCVLLDEEWTRDRFPFPRLPYTNRRIGYWGQGIAERLSGTQVQLNELNDTIRDIQRLVSNATIWMDSSDEFDWEDLTNMPGQVVRSRVPPQLLRWEGTPADLFNERREIVKDAFDQEGLSQALVGGEGSSPGLTSGRAIRAEDSVKSRRFIGYIRNLEKFYMDVTEALCDVLDDIAEKDPEFALTGRARVGRQTFLKSTKWAEVSLPDGDVRVQMFPMAALPTTIEGKFAAVDEWIDRGFVAYDQALDLMEFPDVDAFKQLQNAALDLVRWQIEQLLDLQDGDMQELPIPQLLPYMSMVLDFMNKSLLVAYRMKAPEHVMRAFENYIAHCKTLQDDANAQQQAAPAAPFNPAALDPNAAAAAQLSQAQQAPAGGVAA